VEKICLPVVLVGNTNEVFEWGDYSIDWCNDVIGKKLRLNYFPQEEIEAELFSAF